MWQNWQHNILEEAKKFGYGQEKIIHEGAMKAALENWMNDIPAGAIAELRKIKVDKNHRVDITKILMKFKVKPLMGTSAVDIIIDYWKTFFGESYAVGIPIESLLGAFTEKKKGHRFEYRLSKNTAGIKHGLPHEIFVHDGKKTLPAHVKGTVCFVSVDEGADGKPVLEKWDIKNHVKYSFVRGEDTETTEDSMEEAALADAYAPGNPKAGPALVGIFTSSSTNRIFEYRLNTNAWGIKHGLPHEIFVSDDGKKTRSGNVKETVCIIAVDETAYGTPVLEKWRIKNHVKHFPQWFQRTPTFT